MTHFLMIDNIWVQQQNGSTVMRESLKKEYRRSKVIVSSFYNGFIIKIWPYFESVEVYRMESLNKTNIS